MFSMQKTQTKNVNLFLFECVHITDNVDKLFCKFKYAFMKEVSLDNDFNKNCN